MNANPRLRRHVLANYSMPCSSWQAARPLPTACGDFESTLSQHAAFENRRCLETPLCERVARSQSVEAFRCPHRRGASFSPRSRRRHVVGTPCPSSSPFSIGRDAFFRLHRVETSRPREPAQHPVQRNGMAEASLLLDYLAGPAVLFSS